MSQQNAQSVLAHLASSKNETAAGLAQCLQALVLVSSGPTMSPIIVRYREFGTYGQVISIRDRAFGRGTLARVPCHTALALFKKSFKLSKDVQLSSAVFFNEDRSVSSKEAEIDPDSWQELVPFVHMVYISDVDEDEGSGVNGVNLNYC
ncbi:hypothetical protein SERLA73DRAFT_189653 [Serpula lacrymans var. lacrymans S7.3]|uniref:Uncharacterized protein n=2 Tax=Serpula lacrymans var. lacrymans TaxID=341189 RepID=F8QEB5_SERL3|nr:uncharacterized protein SERLADRAFT_418758 [Serpula lacrymans var. lacrymans S7.9]EGN93490.1 hypothetical protein SERLA73DRAFT_189653 [Serpula lacrymans var. lacrymans S7.3]EGO18868.1 hypothetical protein SERLADRAFT_418758 [Serpula lacrymans var. lacrymans S7.9]